MCIICRNEPFPEGLLTLDCNECTVVTRFPDHLPDSLERIWCDGCTSLVELPDHLPNRLQSLLCNGCTSLTKLPDHLPDNLEKLVADNCTSLTKLPDHLPDSLKILWCNDCTSLKELPDHLPASLEKLSCGNCTLFTKLPKLPNKLQELWCNGCTSLTKLPDHLPDSLKILMCQGCTSLTKLPKLPDRLQELWCNGCTSLTKLPDHLPDSLKILMCQGCTSLVVIDSYYFVPTFSCNGCIFPNRNNSRTARSMSIDEPLPPARSPTIPTPDTRRQDLETVTVDEKTQISTECHDLIAYMDTPTHEHISAKDAFILVLLNESSDRQSPTLCFDLKTMMHFYNNKDDGWFYECTDYNGRTFGDIGYVKIPTDRYTAFVPSIQIEAVIRYIRTKNTKVFYLVPHNVGSEQQIIPRTASYKNTNYSTSEYVSANHCQDGSSIRVYDVKICAGSGCTISRTPWWKWW
jgi:hypothetical protein